jgi:ABC-type sugar transport system ATPase subunit
VGNLTLRASDPSNGGEQAQVRNGSAGTPAIALSLRGLRKSFGRNQALRGVDLDLSAGESLGLVGANGAGKSTLVKSVSGAVHPDGGTIRVGEWEGGALTPRHAQQLGVATIYQDPSLAPTLSLVQNIVLGREAVWGKVFLAGRKQRRHAIACLERVGLKRNPDTEAGRLSSAEQQLLEIGKAIFRDARVVFMDEPTAALGDEESERLFEVIRELRRGGVAVVYISHRLDEVLDLCGTVAVMRDGEKVLDRTTEGLTEHDLVRAMIGHEVRRVSAAKRERGEVALSVSGLGQGTRLREIDFDLHAGEVLGIAGLVGSGRSRLARVLFGADRFDAGSIELFGEEYRPHGPAEAIARGVGLIPEDRKRDALLMHLPAATNITLPRLATHLGGVLDVGGERAIAKRWIEALEIHPASARVPPAQMTGGNQQKLVIARWTHTGSRVYIFDEPGQGVDVGAKERILVAMRELADAGNAVIFISQEIEELEQVADRVLVMRAGRIAGELERERITEAAVIALQMGTELQEKETDR